MAVNGGAGNAISFSELRDFYGDTNPVSLSEFNRGGSNVPDTFTGSQTNTQGSTNQTVDDFGVTVSTTQSFTGTMADSELVTRANTSVSGSSNAGTSLTLSYTVLASDAQIRIFGGGSNQMGGGENPQASAGYTSSGILNLGSQGALKQYDGPAVNGRSGFSGSLNANIVQGTLGTGTFTLATTAGTHSGSLTVQTARRNSVNLNDVTFQNNSSVSTYTLTSDSTGSETVYSPGESQLVKDNQATSNWSISYDNVTGSGSGNAGDIGVTVANGSGIAASTTVNTAVSTATVTAPSSAFSYVNVTLTSTNQSPDDNRNVTATITRNGTSVATAFNTEGSATATYTGTIAANDVFTGSGAKDSGNNTLTINFKNPDKVITYTNNGSSSITLGSSSTGGARSLAAGASSIVQPGGSTNNQSWAVHFDTSSGNCNTNIPTTISAGNPINMDLFNAPGTPVG